jgi:hypothetical protein
LLDRVDAPELAGATGYAEPNYRPPPGMEIPGAIHEQDTLQGIHTAPGPHKDHPEAYKTGFNPHLQVMCGPMLKYDTVENNTWLGYAMMVCSDPGSDYSSKPFLTWSSKPHSLNSPASAKSPYPPSQSPQNLNMAGLSLQDYQSQGVHVDGFQLYRYYALHGGRSREVMQGIC